MRANGTMYIAAVVGFFLIGAAVFIGGSAAGADDPGVIDADAAVQRALTVGGGAEAARLQLERLLLEAVDLQRRHEAGPPRHPLDPPGDYETARVEELLPVQFAALRETARVTHLRELAGLRGEALGAYYEARLTEERREVMRAAVAAISAHRERAEALHAAGEVPEADALRADARLESARADLLRAEHERERAVLRLAEMIGLEMGEDMQLRGDDPPPSSVNLDLTSDLERARELDPAVVAARGELAAAEKEMELFTAHRGGYARRRSYRERELAVGEAEHGLATAERQVELEVRSVHSEIAEAQSRMRAVRRQVEAAERAEEMAVLQYEAGLTAITAVLDASLERREAGLAAAEAEISLLLALTRREALLGEGVKERAEEEYREVLEELGQLR